ncbi:hypothetical protein D3C71_2158330 [compost metagenome]
MVLATWLGLSFSIFSVGSGAASPLFFALPIFMMLFNLPLTLSLSVAPFLPRPSRISSRYLPA